MDAFAIDLHGQNVYTDGLEHILRFERDNVLPIKDEDNNYYGIFIYSNVFF